VFIFIQADWQYSDGKTTISFQQQTAGLLEKAYQEKKSACAWKYSGGGRHIVTFATWTYEHSDGKVFSVCRNPHGLHRIFNEQHSLMQ